MAFAVAAPGLAPWVTEELDELGVTVLRADAEGVEFSTNQRGLCRVNLASRIASRIVVRLGRFQAAHFDQLHRGVSAIEWEQWLPPGLPVTVRSTTRKSRLYHQRAVAQRVEDHLRERLGSTGGGKSGPRAGAGTDHAQSVLVRIVRDRCTISLDSSGELLHRRGWRLESGKAPLRETLAAAMLRAARWHADEPLVDPFCGSGTVVIEAALAARGVPPGAGRGFALEAWGPAWRSTMDDVRREWREALPAASRSTIRAADRDAGAVERTLRNAERAGVLDAVEVRRASFSETLRSGAVGLCLTNPPYGVRVGDPQRIRDLYDRLGSLLAGPWAEGRAGVLCADPTSVGRLGGGFEERFTTTNGGIPVTFHLRSARS